jgi:VIT1/CCC1 family predicted Fe2+/Mn2+ transporter
MNNVFWIPIVAIVGSFTMVVMIVWLGTRSKQRRAQLRTDVQMKLIDKFGSAAEFARFLESPSGRQFLEQPRRMTRERVLGALTGGLITTFIGGAFMACAFVLRDEGFWVPALILLAVGVALFISAAISWKLTKQWESPVTGSGPDLPTTRS